MAQKRITELTEDTAPTADDVVPVTDVETNTTKKVKLSNLSQGMGDVVHKTGNETASGDKTLTGNTTFGTNTEITTGKRVMVAGYSDTLPLQEWGDGTGTVGTYIRRTAGNVMAFIARNNGGYAHEFIGLWKFKNGLTVDGVLQATNYNVVSGQKNAGEYIELDGMRLTMSTTGNRSFGIMTASGSVIVEGTTRAIDHTGTNLFSSFGNVTVSTSFVYFNSAWSMGAVGNVQEAVFYNNTNGHFYKATGIVGPSYTPCRLRLERLD